MEALSKPTPLSFTIDMSEFPLPNSVHNIVMSCWLARPEMRPSAAEIFAQLSLVLK